VGFASGGYVGAPTPFRAPPMPSINIPAASHRSTNVVNVAPQISVKVEGGSQGERADKALADRIGKQVEATMRQIVVSEVLNQRRPGGVLAR
jgi:hypothetical protein